MEVLRTLRFFLSLHNAKYQQTFLVLSWSSETTDGVTGSWAGITHLYLAGTSFFLTINQTATTRREKA